MVRRAKERMRHARKGVVASVVVALTLLGAVVAFADHPDSSGFVMGGAIPDAGAIAFPDPGGNTKELGPQNGNSTKLGVINSDPLPTLGLSNPNGQVDLLNVWFDTNTANGKDWLYFAWERDSTTGSGVIAIEFQEDAAPAACDYSDASSEQELIDGCNPWANRQEGDFLLIWDQVGNDIQISVRFYNGTAFGPIIPLNTHQFDATLNADTSRGEAVVDLGVVFPAEPTECTSIANVIPGTVTGNSDSADYKDTVLADITGAITISNCGSLTLTKTDDAGTPLAGAVFTLYESDGDNTFDNSVIVDTCTTNASGVCTITDIFFGEYWLDETTVPTNHDKATGLPVKVTINGTTTVNLGTFVDPRQTGSIIVKKVLKGTSNTVDGAGFTLDVDGDLNTTGDQSAIPGVQGQTGLFCIDGLLFGEYTVVESTVPAGYTAVATTKTHTVNSKSDCSTRLGGSFTPDLTFENEKTTSLVTSADETVVIGSTISDTATLSGGVNPTGTISFAVYTNSSCTGSTVFTDSKTVNGNGAYSTSFTPSAPGTYYWLASYSGDSSNSSASHDCAAAGEVDTVNAASPLISTSAVQSVIIGNKIHDTASITGGYNLTGTVTFVLYSDDQCSTVVTTIADVAITPSQDGTSATAGPVEYTPLAVGDYYWIATYSGDANNNSVAGKCGDTGEKDTVTKASPGLSTTPKLLPNDSAVLTGGYGTLGGTISFELHATADCSGTKIYSEDQTVNGAGTYTTNNTTVFITADGTYSWLVSYSGDGSNNGATSACSAEQMVIDFTPLD